MTKKSKSKIHISDESKNMLADLMKTAINHLAPMSEGTTEEKIKAFKENFQREPEGDTVGDEISKSMRKHLLKALEESDGSHFSVALFANEVVSAAMADVSENFKIPEYDHEKWIFRTYQAIHDLKAFLRYAFVEFKAAILNVDNTLSTHFDDGVISYFLDNLRAEPAAGTNQRISNAADLLIFDEDRASMERLLGLALALILELQNQSDLDRKASNFCIETAFSATRDLILTAPRPIRAVLLNGLREVDDIELEGIENVMFHSKPREDVYKALISIIKSAELAELSSIASSDYGYMTEKHLKALQFVVASDNCKYPKDGEWYPAEVVELSSHVSSNGGYLIATAIVFLNALYDNDGCSHMEFRWENQHEYYKTLNDPYRSAFLAAVRSEYECIFYFLELNVDASTENPNAAFIPWDFSPPLKQT